MKKVSPVAVVVRLVAAYTRRKAITENQRFCRRRWTTFYKRLHQNSLMWQIRDSHWENLNKFACAVPKASPVLEGGAASAAVCC